MTFEHLKQLVFRIHETTKEHVPSTRKRIAVVAGRLVVAIIVFKDKRLGNVVRTMFSRGH